MTGVSLSMLLSAGSLHAQSTPPACPPTSQVPGTAADGGATSSANDCAPGDATTLPVSGQGGSATSSLPLLQLGNLRYLGAFRVPDGNFGSENGFSFGGSPMAYNPAKNSLFIGGHPADVAVAEVSIPTPVISDDVSSMAFADVLQEFADPTEGSIWDLSLDGSGVLLGGLLVDNGQLFGTAYIFYDADGVQQASHYSRSLNLSEPSVTPFYSVWDPRQTGFVSGYLAAVPNAWAGDLGGSAVTGQCCIPIVTRTSWGPDALAWNPSSLRGGQDPVPAAPLMYYTQDHQTLGPWQGSGPMYGGATSMGGLALVDGTRTALYVGVNGLGDFCYGPGTDDPDLTGTPDDGGDYAYCYDPLSFDQGVHAYPYVNQFWAFDMSDWAAVQAGTKDPWDIMPYGVWQFDLPIGDPFKIGGVAYDATTQRLYVSQTFADADGFAFRPLIHVFQIQ